VRETGIRESEKEEKEKPRFKCNRGSALIVLFLVFLFQHPAGV
jgi:hypothetical protein